MITWTFTTMFAYRRSFIGSKHEMSYSRRVRELCRNESTPSITHFNRHETEVARESFHLYGMRAEFVTRGVSDGPE